MRNSTKGICFLCFMFACLVPLLSPAQTVSVTGVVKDGSEKGEPMVGVAVTSSDGRTGVSTDSDGRYTLHVSPKDSLRFSYIGYNDITILVGGRTTLDVVMKDDASELEEVVVIAYGQQKKVTLTGSVASIGGSELMKSSAPSLGNALAGKIPGIQTVQYSGRPGVDDPEMFIRGVTTLSTSGSQPLIMVDGVERSFTQIDPNEVASISVLKDASATAVFGVRGANGVILITTKRGESGRVKVEASAAYGMQKPTKFVSFADSYTYANMYNYAQITDGIAPEDVRFKPDVIRHFKDQDMPLIYPSIDWMSYVMKSFAPQTQYNVNVSGGSKRVRFFTSVGVLNQGGLFKTFSTDRNSTFKYDRYNYRTNLDIDMGRYHALSINLGGRVEQTNDMGVGEDEVFRYLMIGAPFAGAGIVDGKRITSNEMYVGKTLGDGMSKYYGLGYSRDTKNILNLDLQYKLDMSFLTEGLTFGVKMSYNSDYTFRKRRSSSQPLYKPMLQPDGSVGLERIGDTMPLFYDAESSWFGRNWYLEGSFNYARSWGRHDFSALLLYNQSKTYYPAQYMDLPSGYVGLVGRVTYNYDTKYLLDLNAGYNGSENFAKGRRYGFFPSVSAGWIVSSENFMKHQTTISYLKLRYSVGLVGNDRAMNQRRYLYIPGSYAFNDSNKDDLWNNHTYQFGSTNDVWMTGAYEKSAGNPDVTWEKSLKQNIGFDLKMFGNKLGITADFFHEKRRDILIDNTSLIPAATAQIPISLNYGRVNSKGYEISLSWSHQVKDFYYSIAPSISYSRNTIIEMAEVPKNFSWQQATGHPVGQPFGYEFFELYEPGETEQRYKDEYGKAFPGQIVNNINLKRGDATYVDLTGDGKIDSEDMHAIGYPDYPEFTYGLNTYFKYKGFDFSMTWSASDHCSRLLGDVYRPQFGEQKIGPLTQWVADNSWTENNTSAMLPRISFQNEGQNTVVSRLWLVDASFIRLRNVELGYNFTQLAPVVDNIRVYVSGTNLLTFSPFKGNDPENRGGTNNQWIRYPVMKVLSFGVRVTF